MTRLLQLVSVFLLGIFVGALVNDQMARRERDSEHAAQIQAIQGR